MNDKELEYLKFKNYIDSFLALNGTNRAKLVKMCNEHKKTSYKDNDFSRKLKSGTIRIFEIKDILNELGADLKIVDKNNNIFKGL